MPVCVWDEVRARPNLSQRERERSRGLPRDSRGNGSAPSSTVLLRWWMERSVCRMLSAVALARAAAREHGQLLWGGETHGDEAHIVSQSSSVDVNSLCIIEPVQLTDRKYGVCTQQVTDINMLDEANS